MSFMLRNWAKLYSNQTPAEKALEPAIAALGLAYRSQHPFWALACFADFVILPLKLVVEVDDKSHNETAKRKRDAVRTAKLAKAGWTVARTTNAEALADPAGALDKLLRAAGLDPSRLCLA